MSDAIQTDQAETKPPRQDGPWSVQHIWSHGKSYGVTGVEVVNIDDAILCHGSGGSKSYGRTVCRLPVTATPTHNEEWLPVAHLLAAAPNMRDALKALLGRYDEERGAIDVAPEGTCQECTGGITPHRLDKGPCAYHQAVSALAKAEAQHVSS